VLGVNVNVMQISSACPKKAYSLLSAAQVRFTLMLHKFSAQDRFAASIAAFSGPCSLFLILT
jgi:hypothetical protein